MFYKWCSVKSVLINWQNKISEQHTKAWKSQHHTTINKKKSQKRYYFWKHKQNNNNITTTINVRSEYSSEMHDQRWRQQAVTAGGTRWKSSEDQALAESCQLHVSLCLSRRSANSGQSLLLLMQNARSPVPSALISTDSCRLYYKILYIFHKQANTQHNLDPL